MSAVFIALHQYRAWIVLALLILFVGVVRVRLREMPLERDEGEYAYAGQLILQGIPPYKLAYNMKFPGIYGAYALVMLLFGQTAAGIHLGLLVVNVGAIILMFFLGRRLIDANGGLVAAATFAILSLSTSVLGLAAHASHFVVLAALGGTLLLLRAGENRKPSVCFASGALFGVAFLMKQPGIFWGAFGFVYLAWSGYQLISESHPEHRSRRTRSTSRRGSGGHAPIDPDGSERKRQWKRVLTQCAIYSFGIATPFLLMSFALWVAGVFDRFAFWTFTYAREYVSVHSLFQIPAEYFRVTLRLAFGPNLLFWILAAIGMVLMWWDERLENRRVFLGGFAVSSLMTVCPGWYFRQHYFVFLLPAAALLVAVSVNRGLYLLRHDRTIELFLAVPILGLFPLGLVVALIGNGSVWFEMSPMAACRHSYPRQMFPEEAELASYIKTHAAPDARIAVLGSEPEVYFCSRRHSATGYIYTYPLMERHKFALKMQEEMIREIEAVRPEYLIFVKVEESWAAQPASEQKIMDWYAEYSKTNYELVRIIKASDAESERDDSRTAGRASGLLLLFERKN